MLFMALAWETVDAPPGNATQLVVCERAPGVRYALRVRAVYADGGVGAWVQGSATTLTLEEEVARLNRVVDGLEQRINGYDEDAEAARATVADLVRHSPARVPRVDLGARIVETSHW